MKNRYCLLIILTIFLLSLTNVTSQEKIEKPIKFIEVTGSSEMEIVPDEIHLIIEIQEYWKEEFKQGSKIRDFKTKIPINVIESNLYAELDSLGIKREQIKVTDVGNYWRQSKKEILYGKTFNITLSDINIVNDIFKNINAKGIEAIYLGELKNQKISDFRKQVKIEALKAAKAKAEYLLNSIGNHIGDIISITEINDQDSNHYPFYYSRNNLLSNTMSESDKSQEKENIRNIKLRYEIKARFSIE